MTNSLTTLAESAYQHSLGDAYSHRECIRVLDSRGAPWGTHTNPHFNDIPECNYVPSNPNSFDAHGREFGTRWLTDSLRTDEGILAIYTELVERSLQREGQYYPLGLDAPLVAMSGTPTLRQALYNFVHNWAYDNPVNPGEFAANRRAYAAEIAAAVLAQRQLMHRVYLPCIRR